MFASRKSISVHLKKSDPETFSNSQKSRKVFSYKNNNKSYNSIFMSFETNELKFFAHKGQIGKKVVYFIN